MTEPVRITTTDLTNKVNEGWKKIALAEHYGLPVSQMTQVLKDAGLKIRKFHKPKYELVNDTIEDVNETVSEAQLDEAFNSIDDSTMEIGGQDEAVMPIETESVEIAEESSNNEGNW
jgi:ribosomal protein S13